MRRLCSIPLIGYRPFLATYQSLDYVYSSYVAQWTLDQLSTSDLHVGESENWLCHIDMNMLCAVACIVFSIANPNE